MYERLTANHWVCIALLAGMIAGVVISSTPVVCFCGFLIVTTQLAIVGDVLMRTIEGHRTHHDAGECHDKV
jgi:hypothetical protein